MATLSTTRIAGIALVAAGSVLVSACGSSGLFNRDRPDEFAVQRQTPLVVPPDFSLTPPREGEPRPAERALQDQTLDALFGGPSSRSDVESNAISRAGDAAPGIRSSVGDTETNTVAKGRITQDILAAPEGDGREAQAVVGG